MKSKQSVFEQIIAISARKVRDRSIAGAKDQFQQRMKTMPTKIKQLDADPYMFIFDALISFPQQIDFALTQYQTMISQNFLNPDRNSAMLVQHFRRNLNNHSFRIIQILMDIKNPNLEYMTLFFEIHNSIAMPENVLEGFRFAGYRWLARAFSFKVTPIPKFVNDLASGILKTQGRNLPTIQDQRRSIQKYIHKILNQMSINIQNNLKAQQNKIQSKYGFCLMCLKPADFYCKDTGISVCSSDCKKAHINYIINNSSLDFQYSQSFKNEVQKLLYTNFKMKKNVPLSIQYLCAIYMNSQYYPKQSLPHKQLLSSAVIIQKVWILYTMYYLRRNQIFQHVFADCLKCNNQYISINSAKYLLKIVQYPNICQILQFSDCYGPRRILPTIINNLYDNQNKLKFIYTLIDRIYQAQTITSVNKIVNKLQDDTTRQVTLLRAINYQNNPTKVFKQIYGENQYMKEIAKFIIKNQQSINKNKICQFVLSDDKLCKIFLEQLFIQKQQIQIKIQNENKEQNKQKQQNKQKYKTQTIKRLKFSPFIDQILREIFYFINIKIADKIYHLFELLCQVINIKELKPSKQQCWRPFEPQIVFSPQNTSSQNTMFQFAYFIILVVTQLHQTNTNQNTNNSNSPQKSGDTKKLSQTQFINRVKDFDPKFSINMKQYIIGVYSRLVQFPFSQQNRGILRKYPIIKKQIPSSFNLSYNIVFHPIKILLDNWQLIYQCISSVKNQTIVLYRICSCFVKFPKLCQPFFQLLLNRLTQQTQSQQSLIVSLTNLQKQQHLLPSINSIMQEQPNCIGNSSWKYLFLRDPNPASPSQIYIFQLSILIHYSKSLTLSNFIWFIRQFCKNVKLSQNYNQCLKLLSYNYNILLSNIPNNIQMDAGKIKQQKQRVQILNKQYVQLFINQKNMYYQVQFMKGVFDICDFQLGINLLDMLEINIVTQGLIVIALVQIVEDKWQQIQKYGIKQEKQKQNKQKIIAKQMKQQNSISQKKQKQCELKQQNKQFEISNKVWAHILNKMLIIGINSPHLLQQFCILLHQNPSLQPYFEHLSISHAIQSAFQGRYCKLDQTITNNLQKFKKHISQMHSTRYCQKYRNKNINFNHLSRDSKNNENNKGLLEQFVNIKNIECIVQHFKYFWEIQEVYDIIVQIMTQNVKKKQMKQMNKQNKQIIQISPIDHIQILKILQQNNYKNLIKLQNRLQKTIGYLIITIISLEQQFYLSEKLNIQMKQKNSKQIILNDFKKQLSQIIYNLIIKLKWMTESEKNIAQQKSKQEEQNLQQIERKQYQQFLSVYKILYSYFQTIFNVLPHYKNYIPINNINNKQQIMKFQHNNLNSHRIPLIKLYKFQQIYKLLNNFNRQFKYRNKLYKICNKNKLNNLITQNIIQNKQQNITFPQNQKLPPSLLYQQYIANIINIMHNNKQVKDKQQKYVFNYEQLTQYLIKNNRVFLKLLQIQQKQKEEKNKLKHKLKHSKKQHQKIQINSQKTTNKQINKLQNKDDSNQYELYCEQIQYIKYTLIYIQDKLIDELQQGKQKLQQNTKQKTKLNNILVQYLQIGFDFYNVYTHNMQFSIMKMHQSNQVIQHKDENEQIKKQVSSYDQLCHKFRNQTHYIYNIYSILNNQSIMLKNT